MGAHGAVKPMHTNLILFDGMCNLCSGSVQFIITRDPKAKFQFASLQSKLGQEQLERFRLDKTILHSVILIQEEHFLQRSDAALAIAKQLSGAWPAFYFFKIFPRFFRDGAYDWIARNRYKFFGKKEACWIPTPELKERFLE
jgi:predicted DCC family thiol-disulfide oxidoreductase YuxK